MAREWLIEAVDTFFFRGGQPFNAGESGFVPSLFPPTPETLQGLVRALLLREMGLPYDALQRSDTERRALAQAARLPADLDVRAQLGTPARGELGRLRLRGPYLEFQKNRLYPAPLHLVELPDRSAVGGRLRLLSPALQPTRTDLGKIRLPSFPEPGLKDLAGHWISAAGLTAVLEGGSPSECQVWRERPPVRASMRPRATGERHLLGAEPRVGIGRDTHRRAVEEGHLYAVEMLRPALRPGPHAPPEPVRIGLQVHGVDTRLQPAAGSHMIRFGGEGRLAEIHVRDAPPEWITAGEPRDENGRLRFCLALLTPALFGEAGWLPGKERRGDGCLWEGDLPFVTADDKRQSLHLTILSACTARAARIGGWQLGTGSRPLQAFAPAGSVYFCETDAEAREKLIQQLHGGHVGEGACMGYGWCAVGAWPRVKPA